MNAIILAAGFGTRLKPWTERHPKALVKVEGEAMLGRQIQNLSARGFNKICINTHHFHSQIQDYLFNHSFDAEIILSDERDMILDTGAGVLKAFGLFGDNEPVLVHNVDILSNADLKKLYMEHCNSGADVTLLVSKRDSSRRLLFDKDMRLNGWKDMEKNIYKPADVSLDNNLSAYAFSGIYMIGNPAVEEMKIIEEREAFPIMDYFLNPRRQSMIKGTPDENLVLLDIGKPATLAQASDILKIIKGL